MVAESKVLWTTFVIAWITFPIYWLKILILALLLYLIMQVADIITWYISARKRWAIASWIIREWLVNKFTLLIWVMLAITITIFLTTALQWAWLTIFWIKICYLIALFPLVTTILFIYMEFLSILENLAYIFKWTRQGKLFSVISFLWNKLFNVSIDKLANTAEKKIDSKFKNNFK